MKKCQECHYFKPIEDFFFYGYTGKKERTTCEACLEKRRIKRRIVENRKAVPLLLERLWSGIQQCDHEDICIYCCWPWMGTTNSCGYGQIGLTSLTWQGNVIVTRLIYEIWNTYQIPDNMRVLHYCDFPACSNPLHLWLGNDKDNRQDCVRKNRTAKGIANGHYTHPEAYPKGSQSTNALLTESQVIAIRHLNKSRQATARQLAETYGVSIYTIKGITRRLTWKHI